MKSRRNKINREKEPGTVIQKGLKDNENSFILLLRIFRFPLLNTFYIKHILCKSWDENGATDVVWFSLQFMYCHAIQIDT